MHPGGRDPGRYGGAFHSYRKGRDGVSCSEQIFIYAQELARLRLEWVLRFMREGLKIPLPEDFKYYNFMLPEEKILPHFYSLPEKEDYSR